MAHIAEPHQYTLKRPVSCQGVGLHGGKTVHLKIHPAPADFGIVFLRTDLPHRPVIPVHPERVVDTTLATTLANGAARVATTEHLLAALHGLGIDNAAIEIDGAEVPIMDGSAAPFVRLLKAGGRKRQRVLRNFLRITRPISCSEGKRRIMIRPYNGFKVTGTIQFDDHIINQQRFSLEITPERFHQEIAEARTFGFVEQVEHLWSQGLAQGSTLDNVIAIHWNRKSILNEDGLRFTDEFVRHKILDIIGDLALLGTPILGHVIAHRSGHSLHVRLLEAIEAHPECREHLKLYKRGTTRTGKVIDIPAGRPPLFLPKVAHGTARQAYPA